MFATWNLLLAVLFAQGDATFPVIPSHGKMPLRQHALRPLPRTAVPDRGRLVVRQWPIRSPELMASLHRDAENGAKGFLRWKLSALRGASVCVVVKNRSEFCSMFE